MFKKEYGSEGLLRKEIYMRLPVDGHRKSRIRKLVVYPGPYHDFQETVS